MPAEGAKNSLNGYLMSLAIRSGKTLLVEGPSDSILLRRIKTENAQKFVTQVSIDPVNVISDAELAGLGNKERLKKIINLAESRDRISDKLGVVFDREWDDLKNGEDILLDRWFYPQQGDNKFVTLGHSIENYHFNVDCVVAYLRYLALSCFSSEFEKKLRELFPSAIALAFAFSRAVARYRAIEKCGGILNVDHININDRFELAQSIVEKLAARSVPAESAAAILAEVVEQSNVVGGTDVFQRGLGHWLVHGHIGTNTIWTSIAKLAQSYGATSNEVGVISRPTCEERDRFWRDWLAKLPEQERQPLDEALTWASS